LANFLPLPKRIFDIAIVLLASPLWVPTLFLTATAILLTSGWPIIYLSKRYVKQGTYRTVVKFRAMVKNAEMIANRDTVAHQAGKLLNITIQPELYTPLGRLLEKIHFTELPQLIQVLTGTLTLVGNRPMPENMLRLARQTYPYIDERFAISAGITGPAQLAGRDRLSDQERLHLEISYVYICKQAYSPFLDIHLLLITLCTPFGFFHNMSHTEVEQLLYKYTTSEQMDRIRQQIAALAIFV
jgi:lipopolysaccharide/colanic/teichoic acid biosynthesis glycosyltransferase